MRRNHTKLEVAALYCAVATTAVAFVVAVVWLWGDMAPLFGRGSIGAVSSVLVAAAALVGFLLSYRAAEVAPAVGGGWRRGNVRRVATTGALAVVHAAIGLLLTVVAFFLIQSAFQGVRLDHWTAAALAAVAAGVGGYVAYLAGAQLTGFGLSTTLAVFLVSGMLASMITAPNPYWWQIHFSSIGAGSSAAATTFNATLILAGLVVVGLADLLAEEFGRWQATRTAASRARVSTIRTALVIIGVMLACVGIFPFDTHLAMHNLSAGSMALVFYALLIGLPWMAPGFDRALYGLSYGLFAALMVCLWLYAGVGYLNLATFELLTAGLIFVWIVVFARHIAAGLGDAASPQR